MATESELKYAVENEEGLLAIAHDEALQKVQLGPAALVRMQTQYYDTPSGALSARRWTLRLRRENERSVVACKTAGQTQHGFLTRGEWQCEADDALAAIPLLIVQGAPQALQTLTADGVVPLCAAVFTRRAMHLRFPDGSEAEAALDFGFLRGGGNSASLCELELELLCGAPDETVRFAQALAQRHHLRPEEKSKFARARMLCGE